jgi:hypothetical protein
MGLALRAFAGFGLAVVLGALPALLIVPLWRRARRWRPVLAVAERELAAPEVRLARFGEVEILPISRLVLSRGGQEVAGWEQLEVVALARTLPWERGPRAMSDEERAELGGHLRRLARRAAVVPLTAGLGTLKLLHVVDKAWRGRESPSLVALLGALLVLVTLLLTILALRRGLAADLAAGQLQRELGELGERLERLPRSRQVWSVDAWPAAWRTRRI